jgi:hypothetical protein
MFKLASAAVLISLLAPSVPVFAQTNCQKLCATACSKKDPICHNKCMNKCAERH